MTDMLTFMTQLTGVDNRQLSDVEKQLLNEDAEKESGFCHLIDSLLSQQISPSLTYNKTSKAFDSVFNLQANLLGISENDIRFTEENNPNGSLKLPPGQDNNIKLKIKCKDLDDIKAEIHDCRFGTEISSIYGSLLTAITDIIAGKQELPGNFQVCPKNAIAINKQDIYASDSSRFDLQNSSDDLQMAEADAIPVSENESFAQLSNEFEETLSDNSDMNTPGKSLLYHDLSNELISDQNDLLMNSTFSESTKNPEEIIPRHTVNYSANEKAITADILPFNKLEDKMLKHELLIQNGGYWPSLQSDMEQHTVPARNHVSSAALLDVQNTIDSLDNRIYVAKDSNRLTVTFEHEGIGKLNINLSMEKGIIHALINATDDTLRNLIGNNMNYIINSLLKDGLNIGDFSVLLEDGRWSGERESQKRQSLRFKEMILTNIIGADQDSNNRLVNIFI